MDDVVEVEQHLKSGMRGRVYPILVSWVKSIERGTNAEQGKYHKLTLVDPDNGTVRNVFVTQESYFRVRALWRKRIIP